MIPIQYALLGFGLSALVGAVLMLLFKGKYDAAAEAFESATAEQCQALSEYFAAKAKVLKAPGK